MKSAEFEEKEYEAPLYNQLEAGSKLVWSPGQVFEQHIGIDRAAFSTNPVFWNLFGRSRPDGVYLNRYDWDFIWKKRRAKRRFPDFRLNLFIQAKRPQYSSRLPRGLSGFPLSVPVYKIDIDSPQQGTLLRVASNLGNQALVCYAAPVFHRITQLYAHTRRNSIVQTSTFPPVSSIGRHGAWWYSRPGITGVLNPEFEPYEGPDFQELLHERVKKAAAVEKYGVWRNLGMMATIIDKTLAEAASENDSRAGEYRLRVNELLDDSYEQNELAEIFVNYHKVLLFARTYNLEWFVLGE